MTLREAGSRRKSLRYDERWSRRELWYAFYRTCFFFLFHVHSYMWIAYSILLVIPLGDMDSSFSTISAQLMVWVWWWEIGCSSLPSSSPPPLTMGARGDTKGRKKMTLLMIFCRQDGRRLLKTSTSQICQRHAPWWAISARCRSSRTEKLSYMLLFRITKQ